MLSHVVQDPIEPLGLAFSLCDCPTFGLFVVVVRLKVFPGRFQVCKGVSPCSLDLTYPPVPVADEVFVPQVRYAVDVCCFALVEVGEGIGGKRV